MNREITLTLTIGRRPDLLAQTLDSLLSKVNFSQIVAINDFSDDATNQVFRKICSNGQLISLGSPLGHHAAIDRLYRDLRTPYVFHCEDDWQFETKPDLQSAITLLSTDQKISSVCFRQIEDFGLQPDVLENLPTVRSGTIEYKRLDRLHEQWHGYTFNPHLITLNALTNIGAFSKFKKERHISRFLRQQGLHVAYLHPGSCRHIGADCSVSIRVTPTQKLIRQFKQWIRRD